MIRNYEVILDHNLCPVHKILHTGDFFSEIFIVPYFNIFEAIIFLGVQDTDFRGAVC